MVITFVVSLPMGLDVWAVKRANCSFGLVAKKDLKQGLEVHFGD